MIVVDLDKDDVILTFTAHGRRVAYTRHELLEALGPSEYEHTPTDSLPQHSLGRSLAWLLADVRKGNAADVEGHLKRLLSRFDGVVSGNPSRIPRALESLVEEVPSVAPIVDSFLRTHPFKGRSTKNKADKSGA